MTINVSSFRKVVSNPILRKPLSYIARALGACPKNIATTVQLDLVST